MANSLADESRAPRPRHLWIAGRVQARRRWIAVGAWIAFLVFVATGLAQAAGHGGTPLLATGATFALLLAPYLTFALTSVARDVRRWYARSSWSLWVLPAAALVIYCFYAVRTDCFSWLALGRLGLFVALPTAVLQTAGRGGRLCWQDWVAIFLIWIPFDTSWLNAIWAWPAGDGAYIFNVALAIGFGVSLFVCWRGHTGVNFRLSATRGDLVYATAALAVFMAIALPIGFATEFITVNPQLELGKVAGAPFGIFFFIAIPEELMFRGLFQNFLRQKLGRPWPAILIASVVFGATHLNNEPLMDWRFFLLASIAGVFYGWTFERSKNLLAPALLHAAVDVIWSTFFHV